MLQARRLGNEYQQLTDDKSQQRFYLSAGKLTDESENVLGSNLSVIQVTVACRRKYNLQDVATVLWGLNLVENWGYELKV